MTFVESAGIIIETKKLFWEDIVMKPEPRIPFKNMFKMVAFLFATLFAAVIVGGFLNAIILLLLPRFGITAALPSAIEWYAGSIGLFSGLIAASAIYIAVGQGDKSQARTQKLLANEKRYDDKMLEITKIVDTANTFITRICEINVEDRLYKTPISKQDFDTRKAFYKGLYSLAESNYSEMFTQKVLYDYCGHCIDDKSLSTEQKAALEAQKKFAIEYRNLYKLLHDYINFALEKIDFVYFANGMWIWEIYEREDVLVKQDASNRAKGFNPDKPWRLVYGVKTNWESEQCPTMANELSYLTDLKQRLLPIYNKAAKTESELLSKLNAKVIITRTTLMEYVQAKEVFERAILSGNAERFNCPKDHLQIFVNEGMQQKSEWQ